MPALSLIPRPTHLAEHAGTFELRVDTPVSGPASIIELLRELTNARAFPAALDQESAGLVFQLVDDDVLGEEGYRLTVTPDGVRAEGALAGLRWAVQTLRQLLPVISYQKDGFVGGTLPAVEIVDVPRYAWRGSLLDVARWHLPIEFVFRYVDLLAMHKLNRLHLHLTDDQGWRFEVTGYPLVTEVGAFRRESSAGHARDGVFDGRPHGGFYRQDELRELVAYAQRRGVEIMPEIDVPGHMQAAIAAYPWLGNHPEQRHEVRTSWGISTHVLNTEPATVEFVKHVLDELVDVFPFRWVHIGGDEVPADEWRESPAARAHAAELGLAGVDELLGWWTAQLTEHLDKHGRRAAVWDEVLDHNPPPGLLVFGWHNLTRAPLARRMGFDAIACTQEHAYFDHAESTDPSEPLAISASLPLEQAYAYRPGDVAGVQGQLWTEYLPTPELVEYRAFPRLAALAEVGWLDASNRDYADFHGRLTGHLPRLDALTVTYRPLS